MGAAAQEDIVTTTQTRTPTRPTHLPDVLPRPIQRGGTLLLVEDSRQTSDCIRLMFQGARGRLRRTETLAGARRHLALYTPDATLIDLGLPDGSGLDLIAALAQRPSRDMRILAMSGRPDLEAEARRAGAYAFIAKPFENIAQFQALLAPIFFPLGAEPAALAGPVSSPALRDDLLLALELLCGSKQDDRQDYALQFTMSLARCIGDAALAEIVYDARLSGSVAALIAYLRRQIAHQPLI